MFCFFRDFVFSFLNIFNAYQKSFYHFLYHFLHSALFWIIFCPKNWSSYKISIIFYIYSIFWILVWVWYKCLSFTIKPKRSFGYLWHAWFILFLRFLLELLCCHLYMSRVWLQKFWDLIFHTSVTYYYLLLPRPTFGFFFMIKLTAFRWIILFPFLL